MLLYNTASDLICQGISVQFIKKNDQKEIPFFRSRPWTFKNLKVPETRDELLKAPISEDRLRELKNYGVLEEFNDLAIFTGTGGIVAIKIECDLIDILGNYDAHTYFQVFVEDFFKFLEKFSQKRKLRDIFYAEISKTGDIHLVFHIVDNYEHKNIGNFLRFEGENVVEILGTKSQLIISPSKSLSIHASSQTSKITELQKLNLEDFNDILNWFKIESSCEGSRRQLRDFLDFPKALREHGYYPDPEEKLHFHHAKFSSVFLSEDLKFYNESSSKNDEEKSCDVVDFLTKKCKMPFKKILEKAESEGLKLYSFGCSIAKKRSQLLNSGGLKSESDFFDYVFEKYRDILRFDTLSEKAVFVENHELKEIENEFIINLRREIQNLSDSIFVKDKHISKALKEVAQVAGKFTELSEYFKNLKGTWDEIPRIESFFSKYCGVEDTAFSRLYGRYFFRSIAARGSNDGNHLVKQDEAFIFVGKESIGKSTLTQILAVKKKWYTENMEDIRDKKAIEAKLRGRLIFEWDELDDFTKRNELKIKSFLSTSVQACREHHTHSMKESARTCVVIGTTNKKYFLTSLEGNRKFLPITLKRVDLKEIEIIIPQLYAEALETFKTLPYGSEDISLLHTGKNEYMSRDCVDVEKIEQYLNHIGYYEKIDKTPNTTFGIKILELLDFCYPDEQNKTYVRNRIRQALGSIGFEITTKCRNTILFDGSVKSAQGVYAKKPKL